MDDYSDDVHRLAQALCSLCLAVGTASAAPLALTGLSRIRGEARAFFTDGTAGGYFSLTPGEEGGGIRLLTVEFQERSAWVVDRSGTNRMVFGSKDVSTLPTPTEQATRPLRRMAGVPSPDQPPTEGTVPEADTLGGGREIAVEPVAAELAAENPSAVATTDPASPAQPPPRRRATADELFKARNGYGAWEELLQQRHQAELLAISPAAKENP